MSLLRRWWPALAWAIVISTFSTSAFTSDNTSRIIVPILHRLMPYAATATLFRIHHVHPQVRSLRRVLYFEPPGSARHTRGQAQTCASSGPLPRLLSWRATRHSMSFIRSLSQAALRRSPTCCSIRSAAYVPRSPLRWQYPKKPWLAVRNEWKRRNENQAELSLDQQRA